MKPINYAQIIEKAEARRAALESITSKLQTVYGQWGILCATAHRISVVNHEYKQLDSEASEILAQAVGVTEPILRNGLWHLGMLCANLTSRKLLEALQNNDEVKQLTPLQALIATHYQGGVFDHITNATLAQDVGDGLFTFCINEAGDAGGKAEFIHMLNYAIDQMRSLVGELEGLE